MILALEIYKRSQNEYRDTTKNVRDFRRRTFGFDERLQWYIYQIQNNPIDPELKWYWFKWSID